MVGAWHEAIDEPHFLDAFLKNQIGNAGECLVKNWSGFSFWKTIRVVPRDNIKAPVSYLYKRRELFIWRERNGY